MDGRGQEWAEDSGDLRNPVKAWTSCQKEEQGARSPELRP